MQTKSFYTHSIEFRIIIRIAVFVAPFVCMSFEVHFVYNNAHFCQLSGGGCKTTSCRVSTEPGIHHHRLEIL